MTELREKVARVIEEWRPVVGYEGSYEVSNLGGVRSVPRERDNGHGGTYVVPGRAMTPQQNALGYLVVGLRGAGTKRQMLRVHRLVAAAFLPSDPARPHVNHLDHDRANPAVGNLEWCTQAENLAHMTAAGRRANPWGGRQGPRAALSDATVLAVRSDADGMSHAAVARKHGITKSVVGRILRREVYSYVR